MSSTACCGRRHDVVATQLVVPLVSLVHRRTAQVQVEAHVVHAPADAHEPQLLYTNVRNENTSNRRCTRATRCLTRILPYTKMDAQCDKLTTIVASKVDRRNYLFISRVLNEKNTRLLVGCARLDRDPAHSAHGFGQQVASLVLWFGFDDWVIDQINTEATRTPMPSPHLRNLV